MTIVNDPEERKEALFIVTEDDSQINIFNDFAKKEKK
jgi:hypothetical protein